MHSGFIRKVLREPLFHFLCIGVLLFVISGLRSGRRPVQFGQPTIPSTRIVITAAEVNSMIESFAGLWRRPPTADELKGLVDSRVREEVYYREALKMGLDRDDTIIRNRLEEKLDFVSQGTSKLPEPTEKDLSTFLARHSEMLPAASGLPSLDAVRPEVKREWLAEQRRSANEKFYQGLLQHYSVTIELPQGNHAQTGGGLPSP